MTNIETYLGEGVYAVFDGYSITLDLRAQPPTANNAIVLEPDVMNRLVAFRKEVYAAKGITKINGVPV